MGMGTVQSITVTRRTDYPLVRETEAIFIVPKECSESSLSQTAEPHLKPSRAQFNMENGTVTQGEGRDPSGELQSIDGYMNLALEKCEEHVDGVKRRSYGDAFVRGNNVMYISAN